MKLEEVILRDTRANQPTAGFDAGEAPPGTIMYVTDESVTERVNDAGTAWEDISDAGGVAAGAVTSSGLTMATARLLGRTTASTGAIEEITVGSGLSLSAGSLTATGSAAPIASGTSNPVSPSTGDLFYRTDLDFLIYYDGTRWLTLQEYSVHIPSLTNVSADPAATGANLPSSRHQVYVTTIASTTLVLTTNNGTNFWTCQFKTQKAPNTSTNLGASFTTAADTATTWTTHDVAVNATVATTELAVVPTIAKTLSPGGFYLASNVFYRFVIT